MKLQELAVGNWVLDGENSIPMYVEDILHDGTVYLNYPGNEALSWETNVKDLVPIPITEDFLLKHGFENIEGIGSKALKWYGATIGKYRLTVFIDLSDTSHQSCYASVKLDHIAEIDDFIFSSLHQLQNRFFRATGHTLELSSFDQPFTLGD